MPGGTWPAHDVGFPGAHALDFFFFKSRVFYASAHGHLPLKEKWRSGVPSSRTAGERGGPVSRRAAPALHSSALVDIFLGHFPWSSHCWYLHTQFLWGKMLLSAKLQV